MRIKFLVTNLLYLFLVIVEGLLGLRFLLKLFGANPNVGFVDWVYEMSDTLMEPFRGIFQTRVYNNRFILETSVLFAMLMYALLAMLVFKLIDIFSVATEKQVAEPITETTARRRGLT